MKKLCFLLICILLLQMFLGCSQQDSEIQNPVNFYYINKEISYNTVTGVIRSEIRDGSEFQNLEELFQLYLNGPTSEDLQSFLPDEVMLLSCITENETVYLNLSSHFSKLSGINLTTVCSAMLLTAHDYSGVQAISFRAENSKLHDKEEFLLSMDDIVLLDTSAIEIKE